MYSMHNILLSFNHVSHGVGDESAKRVKGLDFQGFRIPTFGAQGIKSRLFGFRAVGTHTGRRL